MKKKIILPFLAALLSTTALTGCNAEQQYQADMDQIRMDDVQTIASYVDQYQKKTGYCPYQKEALEKNMEVEVLITNREIPEVYNEKPYEYIRYSYDEFVTELKTVLEDDSLIIPIEPQTVATFAPNFYIYKTEQSKCFIAAHLYYPNENTFNVQGMYNKYELVLESI